MGSAVIIDDFLDDFESFRSRMVASSYEGETNPADGVFYPGISRNVPDHVWSEIVYKLSKIMNSGIDVTFLFCRISTDGMEAPHQAHHDRCMGDFTALIYLNDAKDCQGGTELVEHIETGLSYDTVGEDEAELWRRDCNTPRAWKVREMVDMRPNRMMIIEAREMHRANPTGGFGVDSLSGRLVLLCFFNLAAK